MNVICPHCSANLDAPEDLSGAAVECPQCGKEFTIQSDSGGARQPPEKEDFPTSKQILIALSLALCLISCHTHGRLPVAVEGWFPLERAAIMNSEEARKAQLKIGWAIFEDANAWYNTPVCENKRWRWQTRDRQTDKQKEQYAYRVNAKPAPRTVPFAVIAIEHLAKRQSPAAAIPKLLIGGGRDRAAPRGDNASSGIVSEPPAGTDRRSETIDYLAYTYSDGAPVAVYRRDVLIRELWFLTGPEVHARKFTLHLEPYEPFEFTVPEMPPLNERTASSGLTNF